jgi:chloramphenicol O-acetyltransferase type B
MMPFAVQVHHAFVDGIHIGKLVDKLQKYLDEV